MGFKGDSDDERALLSHRDIIRQVNIFALEVILTKRLFKVFVITRCQKWLKFEHGKCIILNMAATNLENRPNSCNFVTF